jgi:hypothetical protein
MAKMKVTLSNGRIVDGEITTDKDVLSGKPMLIADGRKFTALDAVNNGISIDRVNDPIIDDWLNTF